MTTRGIIEAHMGSTAVGVCSICSANTFVLEAALRAAKSSGHPVCIESTSSQVNPFGGYTGLRPGDFAGMVYALADGIQLDRGNIQLGGDHQGPYPWRNEVATVAMTHAASLVRECVLAGYSKIHLDTSMPCGDDRLDCGGPLNDEVAARRAADLCAVAEEACSSRLPGLPLPLYVIGTEVPIPGGERSDTPELKVTRVADVERTLELTRRAFLARGLGAAWDRVIAIVVQPGVEFGDSAVIEYDRSKTRELSAYIETAGHLVFEAHSTDYQTEEALCQMVQDHFAILKVGPWLTFAFREAVFSLAEIEQEWLSERRNVDVSNVREALERAMLADPRHWAPYYQGDAAALRHARRYSYSDRCRYYWPHPEVHAALQRLLGNLRQYPPPETLLSQFLPVQYEIFRNGGIGRDPGEWIRHRIQQVLAIYSRACGEG